MPPVGAYVTVLEVAPIMGKPECRKGDTVYLDCEGYPARRVNRHTGWVNVSDKRRPDWVMITTKAWTSWEAVKCRPATDAEEAACRLR